VFFFQFLPKSGLTFTSPQFGAMISVFCELFISSTARTRHSEVPDHAFQNVYYVCSYPPLRQEESFSRFELIIVRYVMMSLRKTKRSHRSAERFSTTLTKRMFISYSNFDWIRFGARRMIRLKCKIKPDLIDILPR